MGKMAKPVHVKKVMHTATKVLLLFLLFSINIALVSGGYTVTPYSPPTGPYDASGADASVSFFQLPLWIQISVLPAFYSPFLQRSNSARWFLGG